ncbi:MAG: ASKHA domain-containing protein, partial [Candidatus Aminicenantes bacterium]
MLEKKPQRKKKELKVKFSPFDVSIDVPYGTTLLDCIQNANLPLKTTCGGKGTCGDCVVQILGGSYDSKPSAALPDYLVSQGYALACQTEVTDDIAVQLPQFRETAIKSIVDSKFFIEKKKEISAIHELNPGVKKIDLQLSSPTLEDNYSDLKRVEQQLHKKLPIKKLSCEYSVLKKLAHAIREDKGKLSVVLFLTEGDATIIDVVPQSAKKKIFGIACDIGTTTVVLHLVSLDTGKIEATASSLNQQISCGEDIISRINYAKKPGRLEKLHELIILTINKLIVKAAKSARISPEDIYYGSFSGNTTMLHLFLNLDPQYIRLEPYVPTFNQVSTILNRDLGLEMNPEAKILCSPAVGSYVGGDITAGLLITPMLKDSKKTSLFIDAGTNGELVIGNKDWLVTCACSAGPAFEGSGIKCGMPASEGAIEAVEMREDGTLKYEVINGTKPKGVCGSGLVDLLAELFINGYIDRHGKFKIQRAGKKIVESEEGKGFLIEGGKKSFWGKDLVITENDIKNL